MIYLPMLGAPHPQGADRVGIANHCPVDNATGSTDSIAHNREQETAITATAGLRNL
jgi:hypothetical protein